MWVFACRGLDGVTNSRPRLAFAGRHSLDAGGSWQGFSGRGLNGKAAWVRLAGQIWHRRLEHNDNPERSTFRPPFAQGFYVDDLSWKAQGAD